jgi:hypothetical protein
MDGKPVLGQFTITDHPRLARSGLADALEQAGKIPDAQASCRKAVSLAEANGDPGLETFRKHAARLAELVKPDGK